MANRIFCLAFLSALASQAALMSNAELDPFVVGNTLPIDPERDETLWGLDSYDPFADEQADIFGDYTMA